MGGIQNPVLNDPALSVVREKVYAGDRLSRLEAEAALNTNDLAGLGALADMACRRRHGDRAYFTVNRQLNPTNVCVLSCRFCKFAVKKGSPGAFELTIEECLAKLSQDLAEVHVVGALHPDWPWERYLDLIRAIRSRFPSITIKAWTAVEIDYFCRKFRKSPESVLEEMIEAGLDALPGGGAEIFSERVRRELFPQKAGYGEWRRIHVLAHRLGLGSNATMLYGHIETKAERVEHMLKLREIQDETNGFMAFVPLKFQPGDTGVPARENSAVDDLRLLAAARLILDNFPHIKAYWVMLGEDIASLGLNFGASDLDGTVGEEKVAHAALASTPAGLARERMAGMIRAAGKTPVERDARYRVVDPREARAETGPMKGRRCRPA